MLADLGLVDGLQDIIAQNPATVDHHVGDRDAVFAIDDPLDHVVERDEGHEFKFGSTSSPCWPASIMPSLPPKPSARAHSEVAARSCSAYTSEMGGHGGTLAESSIPERLEALERHIVALNPVYRAYSRLAPIDRDFVRWLEEERMAERPCSAIHGLFVSVKGSIPVVGLPWTEGSAIFVDRIASRDAGIVARARAAGGIIVGTTTLSELAMYGVENAFEPMGLNPWDVRRTAGGSSTGAGVAASLGLADVNIGTDSGGSIRNPACHCGVVGFMPRIGALSLEGKPNHTPSLSTVGLIARSVPIVMRAFTALGGGEDQVEPAKRLIVPVRLIEKMSDGATLAIFRNALERLRSAGLELVEREIEGWLEAERAAGVISLFECGRALAAMDLTRATEGIRKRAALAKALPDEDVAAARNAAASFKVALGEMIDASRSDATVTPTWPFAAPLIDATTAPVNGRDVPIDPHRNCFVRAANAVDACALTLPAGLYPDEQVPAGIQFMAPGGRECQLLAAAALAEEALPILPAAPPLHSAT
ncbi:MAG: amidase [Pseudolabrys sp.]